MPDAIRKAPSSTPTMRNTLVSKGSISAGCRAADSMYLLARCPIPTHDPIAPRPIMWQTPRGRSSADVMLASLVAASVDGFIFGARAPRGDDLAGHDRAGARRLAGSR